ncbi:MAG: hypothetical protein WC023_08545 [Rhodocyclaceae bacterium]|jgi:hypothetical protein
MVKKLILPAEVKVCATCSYWDGERQVDDELNLVVVTEECRGECLVHEAECDGLTDVRGIHHCSWEPLDAEAGTEAGDADKTVDGAAGSRTGT